MFEVYGTCKRICTLAAKQSVKMGNEYGLVWDRSKDGLFLTNFYSCLEVERGWISLVWISNKNRRILLGENFLTLDKLKRRGFWWTVIFLTKWIDFSCISTGFHDYQ